MFTRVLTIICLSVWYLSAVAQVKFTVNGQYMNRAELRHGYSTLAAPSQDEAFFISQRARVMTSIKLEKAEIYVSVQDIRTWGSTSNGAIDNAGLLSVHEAWVLLQLNSKLGLKMGRQEIKYDEDRIFGNLDWVMQARRHDAAILNFYDSASNTSIHAGLAFNQNQEQLAGTLYSVPNNYKTFQYLYFSRPFGKINASFLFLNNGLQIQIGPTEFTTVFSQTFGPRFVYKQADHKLSGNVAFYYQTGTNNQDYSVSAHDILGEVSYQATDRLSVTVGFETLSGTDQVNPPSGESKSFTPFYGTNHRFNGYMDYFYVNNHVNSVGLTNYYVKGLIKWPNVFVGLDYHLFNSAADIENDNTPGTAASRKLGSEVDLTINYLFHDGISFQAGYSQMFATESMEFLKNVVGGSDQTNSWAYLSVLVRPGIKWPRTGLKL